MRRGASLPALLALGLGMVLSAPTAGRAQEPRADVSGPGPEHAELQALAGEWGVQVLLHGGGDEPVLGATGLAEARTLLGGRFLEVSIRLEPGAPARELVYLIGYDRRNDRYQVVNLDDSATYFVVAQGARDDGDGWISTTGTDDDPDMAAMGFEKAFVFALDLDPAEGWAVQTRFVDTRTEARTEIPFMTVRLSR